MTTAPGHPGRAQWGMSSLGVKAARLLSGSPTSFPPLDTCAHSKPAGSQVQAGESHFEGGATATFGTGFAISTQKSAPGLEGRVVFGRGYPRCRQGPGGTMQQRGWRPGSCHLCRPGCTAQHVNQHRRDAQSRES